MFEREGECTPGLRQPSRRTFGGSGYGRAVWEPGEPIVIREVWGGQVFEARPASVVQDLPRQTTLFVAPFVRCGVAIDDAGVELRFPDRPWHLYVRERGDFGVLSFAWPDTPYSVLLLFEPDGSPRGWYVNLQTPLARTAIGFDTVDHLLDVLIPMDRSSWAWKDEDELAEGDRARSVHRGRRRGAPLLGRARGRARAPAPAAVRRTVGGLAPRSVVAGPRAPARLGRGLND